MNYFIITQQEPFFIYKVVKSLLASKSHQCVGIAVLKAKRVGKSRKSFVQQRTNVYTLWETFCVGAAYMWTKVLGRGIRGLARAANIPVVEGEDVNDPEFVNRVKDLSPEVLVSISPPQVFGENLLTASKYTLNAHASLLPRHRGVFGTWWTLYHKDEYAGITIHTMVEKLDAGDILHQQECPVSAHETQFSLAHKTKALIAPALVHCLGRLDEGSLNPITPDYKETYNYAPSKEESKEFRRNGGRVFRLSDLKGMLSSSFK